MMTAKQKITAIYAITFLGSFIWIAAIIMAPLIESQSHGLGSVLYAVFSPLCHQIPERCFHLRGFPLAVCSRCFGIYAGVFFGLLFFPLSKRFSSITVPKTSLFIVLTAPIAIDTFANFISLWMTGTWIRFALGWLWGIILPYYFIIGMADAWIRSGESRKNNS